MHEEILTKIVKVFYTADCALEKRTFFVKLEKMKNNKMFCLYHTQNYLRQFIVAVLFCIGHYRIISKSFSYYKSDTQFLCTSFNGL